MNFNWAHIYCYAERGQNERIYSVRQKKWPPKIFPYFLSNCLEFNYKILHIYLSFIFRSTYNCQVTIYHLQIRQSYWLLAVTTYRFLHFQKCFLRWSYTKQKRLECATALLCCFKFRDTKHFFFTDEKLFISIQQLLHKITEFGRVGGKPTFVNPARNICSARDGFCWRLFCWQRVAAFCRRES